MLVKEIMRPLAEALRTDGLDLLWPIQKPWQP
jgi:hypothetical protein